MSLNRKSQDTATALGFIAPNFVGFALFVAFPVIYSFGLVFTNYSLKPAVQTRFVGFENIWQLVGFRPIAEANPSGGIFWMGALVGAYVLGLAGAIVSLVGLGKKWPGTRLGGLLGLAGSAALVLAWVFGFTGVSAALLGITLGFGSFFLATESEAPATGRGVTGPAMVLGAVAGVYTLNGPVFARWEPLDPNFWFYFHNTLYLMVAIPIGIAGSLALALVLSEPLLKAQGGHRALVTVLLLGTGMVGGAGLWMAGRADMGVLWGLFWVIGAIGTGSGVVAFRTLFYIPTFTAGIAVMLLWKQIFNPSFGPLNEGLRLIFSAMGSEAEPPKWLTDPDWAKPAMMLMTFWTVVGGSNMLLYLAGISNIPPELYEAADIDGANKVQRFWNVTWPQLAPTTFFIVIMSTIAGLQGGFEQARVMTNGGPAGTTKTLAYYVYEKAFEELELGYASAIAWVLFLMVFVLTALNWRLGNRYVND